ncbi:MAG TPA: DUF2062 domain-containing protein [Opitutaceae bacterium]|nr:DUF2062 domain-containing protein [Opitutaceae bacterium]
MSESAVSLSPATRTFWQRRVRDPIVAQLTQGMTPEKIAQTLAVGSCLALFPILGVTSVLCFLVGIALRLNQPIIQLLNQALWPVHFWAIFIYVRLGETLYGAPHLKFSIPYMNSLFWQDHTMFFHRFGLTALYAIVAWALLAPVYTAAVYYATLPLLRELARLRCEAAAGDDPQDPPVHPVP